MGGGNKEWKWKGRGAYFFNRDDDKANSDRPVRQSTPIVVKTIGIALPEIRGCCGNFNHRHDEPTVPDAPRQLMKIPEFQQLSFI